MKKFHKKVNKSEIIYDECVDIFKNIKDLIYDNNIEKLEKISLVKKISNDIFFPKYFSTYSGYNFYMEKFLYLLSCKLSISYRIYPDYIEEELEVLVKENKKRVFRNSCLNYK